jgi:hypothetical protein
MLVTPPKTLACKKRNDSRRPRRLAQVFLKRLPLKNEKVAKPRLNNFVCRHSRPVRSLRQLCQDNKVQHHRLELVVLVVLVAQALAELPVLQKALLHQL